MIQEIFLDKNRKKNDTPIKDKRNLFRLKKGVKGIKGKVVTNINNIFEYEKEEQNYYKTVRVNSFWSNIYIEYKSNGGKNKILSVSEYLYKIRPYLRDKIL